MFLTTSPGITFYSET